MSENDSDVIRKLIDVSDQLLSSKRKIKVDIDIDGIENEELKSLAGKIKSMAEQFMESFAFMIDLSYGKLFTEPPRANAFANPFKQLHSELRHLTWQIQQIADGDYDQSVSFSGDFSESINKMIVVLRERRALTDMIKENENLFRSIFNTSPNGIVLCDLNHCILHASDKVHSILQTSEEDIGNMFFDKMICCEDVDKYQLFINSLFNDGSKTAFAELRLVSQDGECFWSEQNASMLFDSNNEPKGYIMIFRDISERKAAEAKLMQYTEDLNESNRTKDRMLSIISHDLKSPFSALLGTTTLLVHEAKNENFSVERIRKFTKILNDSASNTFALLINLLEWSRLQSDKIVLQPENVNLSDVIMENVNIANVAALNKNIILQYTTSGNYPIVSDKAMINTILRNLISNAIKYTLHNGNVSVSLVKENNMHIISVQDNGVGIPADKLEMMFKSDTIQSTLGTANEKGTGLGLGLCKEFVNILGGNIWVKSDYGHGATFSFSLGNLENIKNNTNEMI